MAYGIRTNVCTLLVVEIEFSYHNRQLKRTGPLSFALFHRIVINGAAARNAADSKSGRLQTADIQPTAAGAADTEGSDPVKEIIDFLDRSPDIRLHGVTVEQFEELCNGPLKA